MKSESIFFKPLDVNDLPLLQQWLQKPHVKKWYAEGKTFTLEQITKKYLSRINESQKIPSFIIYIDNNPIGFIQYYYLNQFFPDNINDLNHSLFVLYQPEKLIGLDLFIAEEGYLRKGYSSKALQNFINDLFATNISETLQNKIRGVIVDPNKENIPAIRFFKKNGFRFLDNEIHSKNELMLLDIFSDQTIDEQKIIKNNFYIISGGPGSGKTTILDHLKKLGVLTVDEVARQIIKEQLTVGGDAIHGKNQAKFLDLMLSRSIQTFLQYKSQEQTVFFDRGIPELIGYCHLIQQEVPEYLSNAESIFHYNNTVFITPPWKEIYQHDAERKQSWEEAVETYERIVNAYHETGYQIIELPKVSIEARVKFILEHLDLNN